MRICVRVREVRSRAKSNVIVIVNAWAARATLEIALEESLHYRSNPAPVASGAERFLI